MNRWQLAETFFSSSFVTDILGGYHAPSFTIAKVLFGGK